MSDEKSAVRLDPDLKFIETIASWGGGDLKSCFQCATCTVVCPLSPEESPFPRKEVLWAQWGLEERLRGDPDLWLCHRCNDCSERCPRGARTGDVMAALRSYATQEQSWPRFLGRALNRPVALPFLLALPALVVWAIVRMGGTFSPPAGEVAGLASAFWGKMIEPWPWLDLGFIAAACFAVLAFAVGIGRFWKSFGASGVQADLSPRRGLLASFWLALVDILAHRKFAECGAARARRAAHLLILFGFGGLFATTALVFLGMYLGPLVGLGLTTPLPLGHWIKILGNASAIAITLGLVLSIVRRLDPAAAVRYGRSTYQDVLFLSVLALTVATGVACELLRLGGLDGLAYPAYFLHLSFVLFLILFAPYSKLSHVVYHATALTWAHRHGRVRQTASVPQAVAASAGSKPEKLHAA
jgi:quinone-modifying oxidoreductase subunit QmoC